jgi:amidophosphoribosyltransferase
MIKNQYIGRTYVIPDVHERKRAAGLKHNPIKEVVKGKRVIEGDDSIVRGTISDAIANTVKMAGAKEVHWGISYAPIFYPCFCDEANKTLATNGYTGDRNDVFEVGKYVSKKLPSIDGVMFNSVENVIKAIGLPEEDLCTMCITGKNPFKR